MSESQEEQVSARPSIEDAPEPQRAEASDKELQQGFQVPEAYREKPWASKIKSDEDAWKALDNAQALIGKKSIVPDFETASTEEVEQYLQTLRPKDMNAYEISDTPQEFQEAYKKLFYDSGLSKPQAQKLYEGYKKFEASTLEQSMSKEGFLSEMGKSFGDKSETYIAKVRNEIKRTLPQEDIEMLDKLPNNYLGAVYRLVAKQLDAYGIKDSGFGAGHGGGNLSVSTSDLQKQVNETRQAMVDLQRRPHTEQERSGLMDKFNKASAELIKRK